MSDQSTKSLKQRLASLKKRGTDKKESGASEPVPVHFQPVHKKLMLQFERKAKIQKEKLDQGKAPADEYVFKVAPKWLAEANRIGVTHIHGLRLV